MQIAGVMNFSMISLNDYQTVNNFVHVRYLGQFVNLCVTYSSFHAIDSFLGSLLWLPCFKRQTLLLHAVPGPGKSCKTRHKRYWKALEKREIFCSDPVKLLSIVKSIGVENKYIFLLFHSAVGTSISVCCSRPAVLLLVAS